MRSVRIRLDHGDLKATQGDTGHAEIDMITSIYAHILDEDRKVNAQKFESAFYSNPDLRGVRPPEEPKAETEPAPIDPCGAGGAASKVAGTGCDPGRIDRSATSHQVVRKNQISKMRFSLSKLLKTVQIQLADIHTVLHKKSPACGANTSGRCRG